MTNITPTRVWLGDRPRSSSFWTETDFSLFALWFKSNEVRKFLPRACLMGSKIAKTGIIKPKRMPIQREVEDNANEEVLPAKT